MQNTEYLSNRVILMLGKRMESAVEGRKQHSSPCCVSLAAAAAHSWAEAQSVAGQQANTTTNYLLPKCTCLDLSCYCLNNCELGVKTWKFWIM